MRGRSSKGATSSGRENREITFLCSKVNIAYLYISQVQETAKGFKGFVGNHSEGVCAPK